MNRRAQEEIVGVVVVVVFIVIIMVVLLAFMLRQDESETRRGSADISHFIESAMRVNSECVLEGESEKASVQDLIVECYRDEKEKCKTGLGVCQALNNTLESIMGASWSVGERYAYKGFILDIGNEEENVFELQKGVCNGYIEDEYLIRESRTRETIIVSLKMCS